MRDKKSVMQVGQMDNPESGKFFGDVGYGKPVVIAENQVAFEENGVRSGQPCTTEQASTFQKLASRDSVHLLSRRLAMNGHTCGGRRESEDSRFRTTGPENQSLPNMREGPVDVNTIYGPREEDDLLTSYIGYGMTEEDRKFKRAV